MHACLLKRVILGGLQFHVHWWWFNSINFLIIIMHVSTCMKRWFNFNFFEERARVLWSDRNLNECIRADEMLARYLAPFNLPFVFSPAMIDLLELANQPTRFPDIPTTYSLADILFFLNKPAQFVYHLFLSPPPPFLVAHSLVLCCFL